MKKLQLKIVTPAKTMLDKEIDQVTINTEAGQITVLAEHIPLVSILRPGEILIKDGGSVTALAAAGGVISMSKDNVLTILADSAEHAGDIDLEKAQTKAQILIKELRSKTRLDITTYKSLQRRLER